MLKMYLLKCINDKSLHIVTNENVFCDHEKIKENDRVNYQYSETTMDGIIIMISGDIEALELKKRKLLEIELEEEKNEKENVSEKRQRKPKKFSSFVTDFGPSKQSKTTMSSAESSCTKIIKNKSVNKSKPKTKKQKLIDETTANDNRSNDDACVSTGLKTKIPGYERQKDLKLLQEIQNKVFSNIHLPVMSNDCVSEDLQGFEDLNDPKDLESTDVYSTSTSLNSPVESNENHLEAGDTTDEDTEKNADENSEANIENNNQILNNNDIIEVEDANVLLELRFPHQLFGKDWPKKMLCLSKDHDIHCIADHYLKTVAAAKGVTSIARRLMDGVFNPSMILNCTLTGQSPRAEGKERQTKQYDCLDPVAIEVIIAHAIKRGKLNNWNIPERQQIMKSLNNKLRSIQKKNASE